MDKFEIAEEYAKAHGGRLPPLVKPKCEIQCLNSMEIITGIFDELTEYKIDYYENTKISDLETGSAERIRDLTHLLDREIDIMRRGNCVPDDSSGLPRGPMATVQAEIAIGLASSPSATISDVWTAAHTAKSILHRSRPFVEKFGRLASL